MKIQVLRKSLLENNDATAEGNRRLLASHDVVAVNIMGGAGCGKTTLLERLLPQLCPELSIAVLEGDIATTKDAARIAALRVPVIQLLTEGGCHLTASLVEEGLKRLPLAKLDLVLIENVGNPICPANFDLGEQRRIAVLSVTEGDDKPAKYPFLFKVADLVVFSKMDLLDSTNFDYENARAAVRAVNPGAPVIQAGSFDADPCDGVAQWFRAYRGGSAATVCTTNKELGL